MNICSLAFISESLHFSFLHTFTLAQEQFLFSFRELRKKMNFYSLQPFNLYPYFRVIVRTVYEVELGKKMLFASRNT